MARALIKQVAEDVAFDHAISPERVRGKITVLAVEGSFDSPVERVASEG